MEKITETYERACQALVAGDYENALRDFLWLHDNPMPDFPPSEVFRRGYGFLAWAHLGKVYPPAKEKMRELLAEKIALADTASASRAMLSDISSMKNVLAFVESYEPE